MKNFYLGTALVCFVIAVAGSSYQMHYGAIASAIAAAWNFILYKLD
jgi:hypothetical protein